MSRFLERERFAVWGLARSGVAVANLLARHGKSVIASDIAPKEKLADALEALDDRVEVVFGANSIGDAEVVVVSPGLRPGLPIFDTVPAHIPVVSEVEIAREASDHTWLGITGTDGKTTTTELTTHLLETAGIPAVAAGNIGTPLSEVVDTLPEGTVIVAEISAFQLWSTHNFWLSAGAITNIADDHLDYFEGDFDRYAAAKLRLLERSGSNATAVVPADDPRLAAFAESYEGPVVRLSASDSTADFYFDGEAILRDGARLFEWSDAPFIGRHNAFNTMMAWALASSVGATDELLAEGVRSFEPLPHRIEPVATIDGVRWINDSKATNAHAAMAGLEAVEGPLVVIAGGVDKRLDLEPFATYLTRRAAKVVLIGDITERLGTALRAAGIAHAPETANSLQHAVELAKKQATPGSTVVLSPACSSFDMFQSYADRGNQFREIVRSMA